MPIKSMAVILSYVRLCSKEMQTLWRIYDDGIIMYNKDE